MSKVSVNTQNRKKDILFCADTYLEYKFSLRLSKACSKIGYHLLVVTLKPSILYRLKVKKVDVLLIRKTVGFIEIPELEKLEKVGDNILSKKGIEQLYFSIFVFVQKLIDDERINIIFIWNGQGLTSLPISEVAKKNNICRIYFELANLPEKLFIDTMGVNAESSLYQNIELLKEYNSSHLSYLEWKQNFIKYKKGDPVIPQLYKSSSKNNFLYFLDYLYCKLNITPISGDFIIRRKVKNKLFVKKKHLSSGKQTLNKKYIFLPLQINNDTQLVFNSDVNNLEAIKTGYELAVQRDCVLVVKPHPASTDPDEINEILQLQQKLNFVLTDENTFNLILDAEEVVTINSSVGLEALILDKKVTFLGKSFYSELTLELLRNYILSYLVNIDYFSDDDIDINELDKVIKRCLLG